MTEPGNGREPDPLVPIRYGLVPPGSAEPSAACLDEDMIAALAEGGLDGDARNSALQHLATCARCRGAVASVARALGDPLVSEAVGSTEVRGGRWVRRAWMATVVAAAVLVIFVRPGPITNDETAGLHRDPTIQVADAPVPVSPSGVAANPRAFQWTSAAGASQYRLTLFDADGNVIFETRLTDTMVSLPDSIALSAGRQYLWKVEARTRADRAVSSALVPFSTRGSIRR